MAYPSYKKIIAQSYQKQAVTTLIHKAYTITQSHIITGKSLREIAEQQTWPQIIAHEHYQLTIASGDLNQLVIQAEALDQQRPYDSCSPWYIDRNSNIQSACTKNS